MLLIANSARTLLGTCGHLHAYLHFFPQMAAIGVISCELISIVKIQSSAKNVRAHKNF